MARTRLRQLEQIKNSVAYNDGLNMGAAAEYQPGAIIGSADANIAASDGETKTISISGDFVSLGANKDDQLVVSIGQSTENYSIVSASYDAENDETDFVVAETISQDLSTGTATVRISTNKNLRRDLDFIRTQLRLLNRKTNWYDAPKQDPIVNYESITSQTLEADGYLSLSSGTFDAGEPFTLKVYLNGTLLLPSIVNANIIETQHDYTEYDGSQPVGIGEEGTRIQIHFPINSNDIIQLRWEKKQD